ncbi:MAG: hypothetical protein AAFO97_00685 [Pseudomonadota bacterium]
MFKNAARVKIQQMLTVICALLSVGFATNTVSAQSFVPRAIEDQEAQRKQLDQANAMIRDAVCELNSITRRIDAGQSTAEDYAAAVERLILATSDIAEIVNLYAEGTGIIIDDDITEIANAQWRIIEGISGVPASEISDLETLYRIMVDVFTRNSETLAELEVPVLGGDVEKIVFNDRVNSRAANISAMQFAVFVLSANEPSDL